MWEVLTICVAVAVVVLGVLWFLGSCSVDDEDDYDNYDCRDF